MKNRLLTATRAARAFPHFAALTLALLLAATANAQSPQNMFDCERQYRECEMQVRKQNPGNDPCAAYSRCQSAKMCEASRCVCMRTNGNPDPALATEAQAMCYAVLKPHAGNSCDRYINACLAWSQAQHQKPKPKPPAQHPGTAQPLPPDQLPR
ncbi:MAG: hypothetical protein JXK94_12890 [Deltaproteobacteria bacterium]|nr:hypothetical protein [Deltaproteobacteria bacterium]